MVVQHRGGRENDEKADHVGVDHADDGIEVDPLQRAVCGGGLQQQGLLLGLLLFFHFLRGLPEKHVRADGGAEHGHEGQQIVAVVAPGRYPQAVQRLSPRHVHHHGGQRVRQQTEGQQLQQPGVARERDGDLERH